MFGRYFKVWNQLIQIDFRKEIGNVCSPKDSNYQLEVMRRKQKAIHIIQNLREANHAPTVTIGGRQTYRFVSE